MNESNPILQAASALLSSQRSTEELLDIFREAIDALEMQADALEGDVARAAENN